MLFFLQSYPHLLLLQSFLQVLQLGPLLQQIVVPKNIPADVNRNIRDLAFLQGIYCLAIFHLVLEKIGALLVES